MALVLIDGCEDLSSWRLFNTPVIAAARNLNGIKNNSSASGNAVFFDVPTTQQSDTFTIGFAWKTTALGAGNGWIADFRSDAGATIHTVVKAETTGALSVTRSTAATLGTSAAGVVTANTWYYIEFQAKLNDTTGTAIVRVNGVEVLNLTAKDTKNAGTKTVYDAVILDGINGGDQFFDDVYIKTGAGETFLGDITVETLYPNGNGDASAWVGSDGDSTNNYLLVDEVPPSTTDYTKSSTAGQLDQYALTDLTHTSGTILGICHQATVGLAVAGSQTFQLVNRRLANTMSPTLTATSTTYAGFHYALTTDPDGSVPWTIPNVNALRTGIIHTSAITGAITDVLMEPFNDFTTNGWILSTSLPAIATGRTGTGASCVGASSVRWARYTIPSINESAYLTIGFAFKIDNATGQRAIIEFGSDGGSTAHTWVDVLSTGSLEVRLGGAGGTLLAASATGVIPINTYVYIEVAIFLDDTIGFVTARVDGTTVASATGVDTKNAGTKTTFDYVRILGPNSGVTNVFDDLYLTMGGPGAPFKGSITIP